MKHSQGKIGLSSILLCAFLGAADQTWAATINAANCSQAAVQAAVISATDGDTVLVPAGNCTWSGLSLSKGVHLKGAGAGATNITLTGIGTLSTNATASIEISGFTLIHSGGGNENRAWLVSGSWTNKPPLIHDNTINVTNAGFFRWEVNNGVIYRNVFTCTLDESVIQHKHGDSQSWSTPDTLGMRDTNGNRNLYVEDNVFNNCTNQGIDMDDSSRSVVRYNVFNNSSWNSHGFATSPIGNRHFEIYNNQFNQQNNNVNQSWQIWIRGGTGVVFNNFIQDLNGQQWGNKPEVVLSVRAASGGGTQYPGGCCTTYPCIRQIGQGYDGTRQFTDPIRFWNNTGGYVITAGQNWGSCGGAASNFIQNGRDYVVDAPRPNYSPYTYPHPLRTGSTGSPPASTPPGVCP